MPTTEPLPIAAALADRYTIERELGRGGMATVYLADEKKHGRKVAIKFLNEKYSKDEDLLRRFIQEAKAASALNHPNLITVYEIGEHEGSHYMAAEFIDGQTLRERMKNKLTA